MFRFATKASIACALASAAVAQVDSPKAGRLWSPVQDAGTLHLATGRWSRPAQVARPGSTIYNNDAPQPFFLNIGPKQKVADFGGLPAAPISGVGAVEGQAVHGFQFAYTTREVRGEFGYVVTFYDNYDPCADVRGLDIAARIRLMDLPGAERPGAQASWKVTVDLRNSPYEFILGRDEEGGGADARFGWSIVNTNNAHGPGGPLLAGDPAGRFGPPAQVGVGTSWSGGEGVPGTGFASGSSFWVKDFGQQGASGCVSEIPNAPIGYGSFHLQLYADQDHALVMGGSNIGTNYCDGSSVPAVFDDNFESGDFAAGGWEYTDDGVGIAQVQHGAAWRGAWGARCRGTASITKAVSTEGFSNVTLQYARRVLYMETGEALIVEWFDGTSWHLVESTVEFDWADVSFELPSGAGDNPDFQVRFRTNADLTHERGDVDDVELLVSNEIGHIEAFGSESVADNDVTLVATNLPPRTFGLFFFGPDEVHIPLGLGIRCVGGDRPRRLMPPLIADETGAVSRLLKMNHEPAQTSIADVAPITMNFQYWHRQDGSSNLTNALRVHFVE